MRGPRNGSSLTACSGAAAAPTSVLLSYPAEICANMAMRKTSPRTAPSAAPASDSPPPPHHDVPREDRWNKFKLAEFLRALAATQCVKSAAAAVGMSRQSAYKMRNRLKGEPFDIAWEAAFQHGYDALHQAALERALFGVEVPIYHGGEQVGTRRHFDERLTTFLLARRNAAGAQRLSRYGAAAEFWSERWDQLLERVAEGPVAWEDEGESQRSAATRRRSTTSCSVMRSTRASNAGASAGTADLCRLSPCGAPALGKPREAAGFGAVRGG